MKYSEERECFAGGVVEGGLLRRHEAAEEEVGRPLKERGYVLVHEGEGAEAKVSAPRHGDRRRHYSREGGKGVAAVQDALVGQQPDCTPDGLADDGRADQAR